MSRARVLSTVGVMLIVVLSITSIAAADTYPRQLELDVLGYTFRLELYDDTDRVEGLTTVDLRVVAPVETLELDLIGVDGDSGMEVEEVRVLRVDESLGTPATVAAATAAWPGAALGESARFVHADDRLRISLPPALEAGDRLFVHVRYAGVAATGLRIGPNRHGDRTFFSDNWPIRARHWLPTIDHPYDKARSQMVVTAPVRYQVVSNGLLVEETDLGDGRRLTHWRNSVPIATWLNAVGVAEFAVQYLEPFDGRSVETWVYRQDRDSGFDVFDDPTHAVLEFYQGNVGPYAYERLAQVQAASVGGGMESASVPFYGEDSAVSGGVRWRNVIIHEIAHQWFGNAVTESDWDDVWLSEGFATYFTALFIEHRYGRDAFVEHMQSARDRVLEFYADRPDYRLIHENLDDMADVLTGMQYQKGAWVLHMLRMKIGDEAFWEGIRDYYSHHFNGHATTAQFRRHMEEASGQELGWFFDQWLRRGENPRIEQTVTELDDGYRLELRQMQPGPAFRLEFPVCLTLDDGTRQRVPVEMTDRTFSQDFGAGTAPSIDCDTELLHERVEGR